MLTAPARLFTVAATLVALTACDSNPVESLPDVTGTYTLVEMGGQSLPVTIYEDDTFRADVISGTLTLRADGTYSEPIVLEFTDKTDGTSETHTETDTGTYTVVNATSITFTSSDPEIGSYDASISGNDLTYSFGNTQVRFRK